MQEEKLPEVGKYNAGQKVVFWSMSILIIILICTGIVIWDQYFFPLTSIEQKRWAILVHALAAVTIICVWIVHVYAAIWVRGTIGAMTPRASHRRLGVAASPQVAEGTGHRQGRGWPHRSQAFRLKADARHVIAWPVWFVRLRV